MRLATFNVLHGRSLEDGRVDVGRLADAVRTLDADVLALQEVDRGQERSGGADLAAIAAEAMGVAGGGWRFAATVRGTPGESWTPVVDESEVHGPAYGIALLCRRPVLAWQTLRLPAARVRSPILVPGPRPRLMMLPDEPRAAVIAVVATPSGPMTVACTHLSFVPGHNLLQLRRVSRRLLGFPQPAVLMGDLNMPGLGTRVAPGWRSLVRAATFPSPAPRVQLDHLLGHGSLPAVQQARAVRLALSDHQALVVDLADAPA